MKRLNTLSENADLKVGDFILFQEYTQGSYLYNEGKKCSKYQYNISKPILAIYLGFFMVDMAGAFNYVKWINNQREMETNENGYSYIKEISEIKHHIEWNDFIDILGRWNHRPNQKELLTAYRNYNLLPTIMEDEFETE